jgi:hypothetical protein
MGIRQKPDRSALLKFAPWVTDGVIGAAANEWVARYRIRAGKRIGSEAPVADDYHARSDAHTSLAMVAAGRVALARPWSRPGCGGDDPGDPAPDRRKDVRQVA